MDSVLRGFIFLGVINFIGFFESFEDVVVGVVLCCFVLVFFVSLIFFFTLFFLLFLDLLLMGLSFFFDYIK